MDFEACKQASRSVSAQTFACHECGAEFSERTTRITILERAVIEAARIGFRSWGHSPTCDAYVSDYLVCDCCLASFRTAVDALIEALEEPCKTT